MFTSKGTAAGLAGWVAQHRQRFLRGVPLVSLIEATWRAQQEPLEGAQHVETGAGQPTAPERPLAQCDEQATPALPARIQADQFGGTSSARNLRAAAQYLALGHWFVGRPERVPLGLDPHRSVVAPPDAAHPVKQQPAARVLA
jgi:hypothetical protein